MKKYLPVFKISFQQEFAYRLNFILWRVRNVIQVFLIFYLWDTVFADPNRVVFGYDKAKILTYVFGLVVVRSIVMAARSIDIAGEVSRGELANYLVKPVSYFKYWFVRDLSSKALNLSFAVVELGLLYVLLKPPFFLQTSPLVLFLFGVSLAVAVILYFFILFLFNLMPLWYPDQAWGPTFLLFIFVEFLGGGLFPLDILPKAVQSILYLTPFPYLMFLPLEIYLGNFDLGAAVRGIGIQAVWVFIFIFVVRLTWNAGLRAYSSEGR